mmetsp:Transcript_30705/g.94858  ORF Transcript_30705/g.94858 Transcript_30705/m.94858 type:complete len:268 (-) Transcript_30705:154-957(-)
MNDQQHSYLKELPKVERESGKRAIESEVPALKGKVTLRIGQDEHDAHVGSTVWPCGAYLLDSIVEAPAVAAAFTGKKAADGAEGFKLGDLKGVKVLDIGGGTGYVACGIAAAGADVTTTEIPECVPLLDQNATIFNNTTGMHLAETGHVTAAALDWSAPEKSTVDLAPFDVLVVCECFYAIENLGHSVLVDFIAKFLKSGGSGAASKRAVFAFEERDDDIEADILVQLKAKGAHVHALRKSAPVTKGESNQHPDPVHYQILVATLAA